MTSYDSPLSSNWPNELPTRFTSCCLSREGNLVLARVQSRNCLKKDSDFLSNERFSLAARIGAFGSSIKQPMPRFCVDLETVEPYGLHLILWDRGVPYMFGLLIPSIRELAGLEAVGWFSREHELSLKAFLACVREVRLAEEELPLLLTIFNARGPRSLTRLDGHWRLMEAVAIGVESNRRSARGGDWNATASGVDVREQRSQVPLSTILSAGRTRIPHVNRLSG